MIFAFFKSKLDKILLGLAALGALLIGAFLKGKASQRRKTNAKTVKTILKTEKKKDKNEKTVRDKSGGSAAERLRKDFSRDK